MSRPIREAWKSPSFSNDYERVVEEELRKDGTIDSIRAQLRSKIIKKLLSERKEQSNAQCREIYSLKLSALCSLIYEFFQNHGMKHTIDVFAIESGINYRHLSQQDALEAFGIVSYSEIYSYYTKNVKDKTKCCESNAINAQNSRGRLSTIQLVFSIIPMLIEKDSRSCSTTQTETSNQEDIFQSRKKLDTQLGLIEKKYKKSLDVQKIELAKKLDKRMAIFKDECDKKKHEEMLQEMNRFKSLSIIKMKSEEARKRQEEIKAIRKEIEAQYYIKLQKAIAKERSNQESLELKRKDAELSQYQTRQELLNEINKVKNNEAERKRIFNEEMERARVIEEEANQTLNIAKTKLECAEKKEAEVEEKLLSEYDRVQNSAKRAYDDAAEAVRKQGEFYSRELNELRNLRESYVAINDKKLIETEQEVKKLREENIDLRNDLEAAKSTIEQFNQNERHKIKEKELSSMRHILAEMKGKLSDAERNLLHQVRREEKNKNHMKKTIASLKNKLEKEREMSRVTNINAIKATSERDSYLEELEELRLLLKKSQNTLSSIKLEDTERNVVEKYSDSNHFWSRHQTQEDYEIKRKTNHTNVSNKNFVDVPSTMIDNKYNENTGRLFGDRFSYMSRYRNRRSEKDEDDYLHKIKLKSSICQSNTHAEPNHVVSNNDCKYLSRRPNSESSGEKSFVEKETEDISYERITRDEGIDGGYKKNIQRNVSSCSYITSTETRIVSEDRSSGMPIHESCEVKNDQYEQEVQMKETTLHKINGAQKFGENRKAESSPPQHKIQSESDGFKLEENQSNSSKYKLSNIESQESIIKTENHGDSNTIASQNGTCSSKEKLESVVELSGMPHSGEQIELSDSKNVECPQPSTHASASIPQTDHGQKDNTVLAINYSCTTIALDDEQNPNEIEDEKKSPDKSLRDEKIECVKEKNETKLILSDKCPIFGTDRVNANSEHTENFTESIVMKPYIQSPCTNEKIAHEKYSIPPHGKDNNMKNIPSTESLDNADSHKTDISSSLRKNKNETYDTSDFESDIESSSSYYNGPNDRKHSTKSEENSKHDVSFENEKDVTESFQSQEVESSTQKNVRMRSTDSIICQEENSTEYSQETSEFLSHAEDDVGSYEIEVGGYESDGVKGDWW